MISWLPYANPASIEAVLQDTGRTTPANYSTGVLTPEGSDGVPKTRLTAAALENAGLTTRIVDIGDDGLRVVQDPHVQALQDPGELFGGLDPAPGAVGDEAGRLVAPLPVQVVQRVLQHRRVAPVVLWEHEQEPVVGLDGPAPDPGVLVLVVAERGLERLVEEG